MSWERCRNCGAELPPDLKAGGYCSPQCKLWAEAEKDYEMQRALLEFGEESV